MIYKTDELKHAENEYVSEEKNESIKPGYAYFSTATDEYRATTLDEALRLYLRLTVDREQELISVGSVG